MKKIFLLLIITTTFMNGQQLAFPSAVGAGAYTTGGRGGEVVHVTNLNDSGVGSFRWALTDNANKDLDRTIVFDVSGVIKLETVIRMSNIDSIDNAGGITIAGFTAPLGGITIIGQMVRMRYLPNLIVRGVRFRGGYNFTDPNNQYSKSTFLSSMTNGQIIDHCSSSFALEQALGGTGGRNDIPNVGGTYQYNLAGSTARVAILGVGISSDETYRGLPVDISWVKNVMVDCGWRTPNVSGNTRIDLINNFVHNWSNRTSSFTTTAYDGNPSTEQTVSNIIGNYYQAGSNSRNSGDDVLFKINDNNDNPQFYYDDNFITADVLKGRATNYNYQDPSTYHLAFSNYPDGSSQVIPNSWFRFSQFSLLGESLSISSSQDIKTELLPTTGAVYYTDDNADVQFYRDAIDTELVLRADTNSSLTKEGDYQARAEALLPNGSNPMPSETRPENFYQSNPHIPEAYFTKRGITGNATIHNEVQASGYTLLEEYINQKDGDVAPEAPSTAITNKKRLILITN